MNAKEFIENLKRKKWSEGRILFEKTISEREPIYEDIEISEKIREYLQKKGITQLYSHQTEAINLIRTGKNVVTTTPTSSGKTIIFNIAVFEEIEKDKGTHALYVYPTNALANDQQKKVEDLIENTDFGAQGYVFTGQTPYGERKKIKKANPNILITNPDMLHVSIIPYHFSWKQFYSGLKFVIIDEVHVYRGIFGTQVSHVLHRLKRIAEKYGSNPQFVMSSATIANPEEHCKNLIGEEVIAVKNDGSASTKKHFILWQTQDAEKVYSWRDPISDSTAITSELFLGDFQTINFVRSRILTGQLQRLIWQSLRYDFNKSADELRNKVRHYSGDMNTWLRKKIENDLKEKTCQVVISTNALELGIDIGHLDSVVITGYPGTIMEFWQEAGRAGRWLDEAIIFLLATNDSLDQYIARNPMILFEGEMEYAVIDRSNEYILSHHLKFASQDFSKSAIITEEDVNKYFEESGIKLLNKLEEMKIFKEVRSDVICGKCHSLMDKPHGEDYVCTNRYCRSKESLKDSDKKIWQYIEKFKINPYEYSIRMEEAEEYDLFDLDDNKELEAEIDKESLHLIAYPGAIYVLGGVPYRVIEIDEPGLRVNVKRETGNLKTSPQFEDFIEIVARTKNKALQLANDELVQNWGRILVVSKALGYKEFSYSSSGQGRLIDEITYSEPIKKELITQGFWIDFNFTNHNRLGLSKYEFYCAIHGMEHVVRIIAPSKVLCEARNILGVTKEVEGEKSSYRMLIYDNVGGGIGLTEKLFDVFDEVLIQALDLLRNCSCGEKDGCPLCMKVKLCESWNDGLNKEFTIRLIQGILGK